MGNHYCINCFVQSEPYTSKKIADALERNRNKTYKCLKCKQKYKSDWCFKSICETCTKEGWAQVSDKEKKFLRNWNDFYIITIIHKFEQMKKKATMQKIIKAAEDYGIKKGVVRKTIRKLWHGGDLYQKKEKDFKIVGSEFMKDISDYF